MQRARQWVSKGRSRRWRRSAAATPVKSDERRHSAASSVRVWSSSSPRMPLEVPHSVVGGLANQARADVACHAMGGPDREALLPGIPVDLGLNAVRASFSHAFRLCPLRRTPDRSGTGGAAVTSTRLLYRRQFGDQSLDATLDLVANRAEAGEGRHFLLRRAGQVLGRGGRRWPALGGSIQCTQTASPYAGPTFDRSSAARRPPGPPMTTSRPRADRAIGLSDESRGCRYDECGNRPRTDEPD